MSLTPMDTAKDAFLGLLATLEGDELLSFETFVGAAIGKKRTPCVLAHHNAVKKVHKKNAALQGDSLDLP